MCPLMIGNRTTTEDKPQLLLTALTHAREPASLVVGIYMVGQMLGQYTTTRVPGTI